LTTLYVHTIAFTVDEVSLNKRQLGNNIYGFMYYCPHLYFPLLRNDSISIETVLSVALDERIVKGYGAVAGTELIRETEVLGSLSFCPTLVPRDLGMNPGRRGGRTANCRRPYRKFSDDGSDRTQNLVNTGLVH
jgi:hypothetical protein